MIKALNIDEFHELVFPYMKDSFPVSEIKSLTSFDRLLSTGKYIVYGYYEKDILLGYAIVCEYKKYYWLDYLCVLSKYRNSGSGFKIVNELLALNPDKEGIFLEVEPVNSYDYEDNNVKRMRFYSRLNIHLITDKYLFPIEEGGLPLNLCFLPKKGVSIVKREDILDTLSFIMGFIHQDIKHAYDLLASYSDSVHDVSINYFEIDKVDLNNKEELKDIGRLIYYVDPYIYPEMFDNDINKCIALTPYLLKEETVYNYKNIILGKINGHVAGFMVLLETYPKNNHNLMVDSAKKVFKELPPRFMNVMKGYFDELDYEWEGIQIMSLSVLPEYRRCGVASKMLYSLSSKNTYSLACVRDNEAGRRLYEKCGFKFKYEYPGYINVPCVELVKKGR